MLFAKGLSALPSSETNQFYKSKMQDTWPAKKPNNRVLPFSLVTTIFPKS